MHESLCGHLRDGFAKSESIRRTVWFTWSWKPLNVRASHDHGTIPDQPHVLLAVGRGDSNLDLPYRCGVTKPRLGCRSHQVRDRAAGSGWDNRCYPKAPPPVSRCMGTVGPARSRDCPQLPACRGLDVELVVRCKNAREATASPRTASVWCRIRRHSVDPRYAPVLQAALAVAFVAVYSGGGTRSRRELCPRSRGRQTLAVFATGMVNGVEWHTVKSSRSRCPLNHCEKCMS